MQNSCPLENLLGRLSPPSRMLLYVFSIKDWVQLGSWPGKEALQRPPGTARFSPKNQLIAGSDQMEQPR